MALAAPGGGAKAGNPAGSGAHDRDPAWVARSSSAETIVARDDRDEHPRQGGQARLEPEDECQRRASPMARVAVLVPPVGDALAGTAAGATTGS